MDINSIYLEPPRCLKTNSPTILQCFFALWKPLYGTKIIYIIQEPLIVRIQSLSYWTNFSCRIFRKNHRTGTTNRLKIIGVTLYCELAANDF